MESGSGAARSHYSYRATRGFIEALDRLQCTLVASIYTASRIVLVSARDGAIRLIAHEIERPMGVAVDSAAGRRLLAVSTAFHTLVFSEMPQLRGDFSRPDQPCDAVFLPRACYYTGDIDGHDLAWRKGELLVANTRFSCVSRVGCRFGFEPVWTPPFVTALAPEDRCHLNGVACDDDQLVYVTSLGIADEPRGWRSRRASGGALVDARSGGVLLSTLCVPHSPRLIEGRLFLCESGLGSVIEVDARGQVVRRVEGLPGFTRGLDACGDVLFVGLSKLRAKGMEELPVSARTGSLLCGLAAIERDSGALLGWLALEDFEEIFDVRVLADVTQVVIEGLDAPSSRAYVDLPGRVFASRELE